MAKPRIERSLLFPNKEFRERVRKASKDRGFRSEQAFILAACEREIRRGDETESVTQFEARIAATLTNLAKQGATSSNARRGAGRHNGRAPEVRHYLCCGTPRRCAPSGSRSRQVALRQADPRCGERALEQKQRHSEGNVSRLLTDRWCDCDRESHNTAKLQCAKSLFENTFNGAICIVCWTRLGNTRVFSLSSPYIGGDRGKPRPRIAPTVQRNHSRENSLLHELEEP